MKGANIIIKLEARRADVPLWCIARELSISEPTLTRLFSKPLSKEQENQIREIIMLLKVENA